MKYEIDTSSLSRVQKDEVWEYIIWSNVFTTAIKSAIGIPIGFLILAIFTKEWHLSFFGWGLLILIITSLIDLTDALDRRDAYYATAKKKQENWPLEKAKKINSIIKQSKDYCIQCSGIRNQLVTKMNIAKEKYNRNLFSQYWDMIESITKSFDEYRLKIERLKIVQNEYHYEIRNIGTNVRHNFPSSILNMNMVPLVSRELSDFKELRELGESHRDFANIWEQRRTREAIITGFKNLQASVDGVGDTITLAINNLRGSLRVRD
ncbi:hypothetical protein [Aliikangiella maris]|uniref:SLATT domain-containing protein n=2 Tax=Aliikangiella maris TaxID=3162458 RepID=A0ABV2BZP7_9GAMM